MYLKSLVLKGFKSFANRSVLNFRPGISAIVGPNGSGKSNISDAVLWVLGELNPKHLRGNTMQDVIFAGSSAKKPVNMAEVTLVLDNSDGTLPVDFDEVSISRRMYRSGDSEYLINGTVARRMDVLDILHDSGLGTGTSSIISQGHLNSVLASKPEDRRALIEEAAGILKHKQRKQKSMRKLERMDQSLLRVNDVVSEVQRQVRPLARKAHKAQRYTEISEELSQVRLALAVDDLRTMQRDWDAIKTRKNEAQQLVEKREVELKTAEEAFDALQKQLQVDAHAVHQASEAYRRGQTIVDKLESNVMLLHQREQSAHDYLDEMGTSANAQQSQLEALRTGLSSSQHALQQMLQEQSAAHNKVDAAQKKEAACRKTRNDIQQALDEVYANRKKHNTTLRDAQNSFNALRQQLNDARGQEKSLSERHERLTQAITHATDDVTRAQMQHAQAQKALQQTQQKQAQTQQELQSARAHRDELHKAADAAQDEWSRLQAQLAGLQEIERAHTEQNPLLVWAKNEKVKDSDAVSLLLDALEVSEDVSDIVTQILGQNIDSIVVEKPQDAAAIISDALHSEKPGRLSIQAEHGSENQQDMQAHSHSVPADGAQGTSSQDLASTGSIEAETVPAGCTALLAHVHYPAQLSDICQALFGNVYVCDSEDAAFALSQKMPSACCMTHNGVAFGPFGSATLERNAHQEDNPVARHHQMIQAKKDLVAADKKRLRTKDQLARCDASIDTLSQANAEASRVKAQREGELTAANSALLRTQNRLDSLNSQLKHVVDRLEQAKRRVADIQPKLNASEKAREAAERALNSIGTDSDELERKIVPARSDLEAATNELVNARSDAAAVDERVRSTQQMIQQRRADIESQEKQLSHAQQNVQRKYVALHRVGPLIDICETLVSEAKVRTSALSEAAHKTQETSDELRKQIDTANAHIQQLRSTYDQAQHASSDIRVDESRMQMRVDNAIRVITDDCHTPVEEALKQPQLEDRKLTEQKAFELQKKMKQMGNIDPDAQSEYQALKTRLDYLQAQVDDIRQARASLTKIVGYIDKRMQHDFEDTFVKVNQNYEEIFHILFPGGSGKLILTDADDPEHAGVEVIAQPRGKRFLKMSLLSGGEQSLVAMALLFALYKTRSTPFYILDEVEAALDDTNLRRLLAYINSMRGSMQFIAITHQRRTMELADVLYGISMQADGISHVISQRLNQASRPVPRNSEADVVSAQAVNSVDSSKGATDRE